MPAVVVSWLRHLSSCVSTSLILARDIKNRYGVEPRAVIAIRVQIVGFRALSPSNMQAASDRRAIVGALRYVISSVSASSEHHASCHARDESLDEDFEAAAERILAIRLASKLLMRAAFSCGYLL